MTPSSEQLLGSFLRDRRARLDPTAFGFAATRRRTPGLRREEVAQRANVSATWYTWLEQGRGGGPSPDVLDRVARALELTPAEREHLFLLAERSRPAVREKVAGSVSPRLQRTLDSMELNPALIKNAAWDILAWNHAAATVLIDYAALPVKERNVLRLWFNNPVVRAGVPDWESEARFAVSTFRLESARGGAGKAAAAIVAELRETSPEFAAMWDCNEVSTYGEGTKHIEHPLVGALSLEFSTYAVDGQPDLGMVIYTPSTAQDRARVRTIVDHTSFM
jgi:transcriptional regulator with XRE-family HTH domain